MFNNRGQVLVLFLLLIPVLLIVLVIVIDIGNVTSEKIALENLCSLAIDEEDINKFVSLNDKDIDVSIKDNKIILEKRVDGLLSHVIDLDFFDLKVVCEKGDLDA